MSGKMDQTERNGVAAAYGKTTGAAAPEVGDAGGSRFNHFAERVLPTLKQLRAARKAAEALSDERASLATARIGRHALDAIRSIDTILRTTGVYHLSELEALESDATRMNAVCCVLNEVGERLRALAGEIARQEAQVADLDAIDRLAALSAVLTAPIGFGPDGADPA